MRPENRYGQMSPSERVAFALSEEGKNYLFPWGFTVDGKRYEKMVSGRVARVFNEEGRLTGQSYSREESSHIFRTAFLLYAGYVDAATTFAQNCGGGGSAPDQPGPVRSSTAEKMSSSMKSSRPMASFDSPWLAMPAKAITSGLSVLKTRKSASSR